MSQATPTQHLPVTLVRQDGTEIDVPSAEFFTRRRMVWTRGYNITPGSLKAVIIAGATHAVRSIETKDSHCEILLVSE